MKVRLLSLLLFTLINIPLYAQQPNILFILADDLSYPYSSVYGDQVIKTPNQERLAQGVTFTYASLTPHSAIFGCQRLHFVDSDILTLILLIDVHDIFTFKTI